MKYVIDIDENVFTRLFDNGTEDYEISNDDLSAIAKAIRNGIPLPKGHGRLIDVDQFLKTEGMRKGNFKELWAMSSIYNRIGAMPTIVEADKEGATDGTTMDK